MAGLFLIVFGTKVLLIAAFGSPVPYWDQWDAEAANLFVPYLDGHLSLSSLIEPHNEHRILLTRLMALVLFELAGEWDPILEMLLNAVIHAAFVTGLAWLLLPLIDASRRMVFLAFMALAFGLPIGWENTLAGFQSQFYFLLIFSTLMLLALARATAFSPGWFAGVASAIAAFFSLASGALGPLTGAALAAAQIATGVRSRNSREVFAIILLIAIAVVMVRSVPLAATEISAKGPADFVHAALAIASVPLHGIPGGVILAHLPLGWFVLRAVRVPLPARSRTWLIVGLAGWLVAQVLSVAYSRAAGALSARYLDIVLIALPLDLVALFAILDSSTRQRLGAWLTAAASTWVFVIVTATIVVGYHEGWSGALGRGRDGVIQQQNVMAYLASGDMAALVNKPMLAIPYPSPQRLADLLSNSMVRAMLPDAIRPADADINGVRQRTLLKGRFAQIVGRLKSGVLLSGPALLGAGLAAMFAFSVGRAGSPRNPSRP
ncbi:MAG TPA: hypothetical protein VHA70_05100 [Bauldia sp.]|nr:hypothetical protein [Bauldia sp.]